MNTKIIKELAKIIENGLLYSDKMITAKQRKEANILYIAKCIESNINIIKAV